MPFLNKKLFSFLLLFFSAQAMSDGLVYEKCPDHQEKYTQRIIQSSRNFISDPKESEEDTEASFCLDCSIDELLANLVKMNEASINQNIPKACFLASNLKGNKTSRHRHGKRAGRYYCNKKGKVSQYPLVKGRWLWPPRVCFNKDYVDMTAQAFHTMANCFGFNYKDKKELFALYNHESGFVLNAKSGTGARCYGQLTLGAVKDNLDEIYFKKKGLYTYKEILKTCPEIQKIVPKTFTKKQPISISRFNKIFGNSSITCPSTHNPYFCLFHSMFFIKRYLNTLDEVRSESPNYLPANKSIPKSLAKKLNLDKEPLRPDELIIFKGKIKFEGKTSQEEFLFWDISEMYDAMEDVSFDPADIQVQRLPLFQNNDTVKWSILQHSYNGGSSVIINLFPVFIENLKKRVAKTEACNKPSSKECEYRTQLLSGEPLSSPTFDKTFNDYLLNNYPKKLKRRKEVAYFNKKIESNLGHIGLRSKESSHLKSYLTSLHKTLSKEEILEQESLIKSQCNL